MHGTPAWADRLSTLRRLREWGIAARSAAVSALVVCLAFSVATLCLVSIMYFSLVGAVDDAAAARVGDIVTALRTDGPEEFDGALLATNDHVVAVQIVDAGGVVVAHSPGAAAVPMVAVDHFGSTLRRGMSDDSSPGDNMRLSGQTVQSPTGRYTVIVGGGSEAVESTVKSVALLLAAAAPAITGVAAGVSYRLVRRSLRSVDAIRSRVAEISATELTERVPVPTQRDEISALAETMNDMLARVEAGHRAQRQFVGDASHELRSPLTTIISVLEVADAHPELLDLELTTGTLLPEAHRMRALVEDLLLLARADEQGLSLRHDTVRLDDICRTEATRVQHDTGLAIDTALRPTRVTGDSDGLTRVVRNLVDNAARHSAGRIEMAVHTRDGVAVLVISDDGPGIPAADRARVFDRFVRLDTARSRKGGGSGLGLAIVAEIIAHHDGSITIGDRPGGGALITVTLPSQHPTSA